MNNIFRYVFVCFMFVNTSQAADGSSPEVQWYLKGSSEEKVASDLNNKLELAGDKLTAKESINLTDKVNHHYNNALSFYLKGAAKGNALSAWKAAGLGSSGMSQLLPDEKIQSLVLQAAEGGVIDAQLSLVTDNCNAQYTECKDEKAAINWLRKATKNGSGIAANILGFLYENGRIVHEDINMSFSCYDFASKHGVKNAKYDVKKLFQLNNHKPIHICE
jgi:TPR repeat protein